MITIRLYTNGLGLKEEGPFPQLPAAASAAVVVRFARSAWAARELGLVSYMPLARPNAPIDIK